MKLKVNCKVTVVFDFAAAAVWLHRSQLDECECGDLPPRNVPRLAERLLALLAKMTTDCMVEPGTQARYLTNQK